MPNYFLYLIWFLAASKQNDAPPKLVLAFLNYFILLLLLLLINKNINILPIFTLPPSNALIAILNPSPNLDITFDSGILTSSKFTTVVGDDYQPI